MNQPFRNYPRSFLAAVLALLFFALFSPVHTLAAFSDNASFAQAIVQASKEIKELQALTELAEKYHVKVNLFGGTAASLAQFAWMREDAKDHPGRYLGARLKPEFENVFAPGKDLDVVIDGPPSALESISQEMEKRFPHSMPDGKKSAWEFRPLRYAHGTKAALLNDPEFMGQHNDSLSTSLIGLGNAPEEAVSNLLEPTGEPKAALLDSLRTRQIHYRFSPGHVGTSRFLQGMNPPILSAVRALNKAFEYDLEIPPADLEHLRKVIHEFRPSQLQGYPLSWIQQNAVKLVQNSADIERSFRVMKDLGLWQALYQIGNPAEAGSLAWWLAKDPLPRVPLGTQGQTARELGITTVAHSTSDYRAFQLMSQSPTGRPNVFQSRPDGSGERAVYGKGFYVAKGEVGAWNQAYSLVYDVDPNARYGQDFELVTQGNDGTPWYRFLNENALRRRQANSSIPLAEKVAVLLGIKPGGGNLPPKEFFEAQQGQIANEVRALPAAERLDVEKLIFTRFPEYAEKTVKFVDQIGGLSTQGSSYFADLALQDATKGNWHSAYDPQIAHLLQMPGITRAQQEKIRDVIVGKEKAGWYSKVYGAIPRLDPDLRAEVLEFFNANYFGEKPKTHQLLDIVPLANLDETKLAAFEEQLWQEAKSSGHSRDYWAKLMTTNRSPALAKKLEERVPALFELFSVDFPQSLSTYIGQKGTTETKAKFESLLTAQVREMLTQPVREDLVDLALRLEESQGKQLPLAVEEKYRLLTGLHIRFKGRIAEQGWGSQPHGYTFPKSIYAKLSDSIERDHPTLEQRRAGAALFNQWSNAINPQHNPGLSTGRAFIRTFEALPAAEQTPYKDWMKKVAGATISLKKQRAGQLNRFEGDYSSPPNVTDLLTETRLTANSDPDFVSWMYSLDQHNVVYDDRLRQLVHQPDANVFRLVDQIAAHEGADGLIKTLHTLKKHLWALGNTENFALAFADHILLSHEWADRPDLLVESVNTIMAYVREAQPQVRAAITQKLQAAIAMPHWQENAKLKKFLGEGPVTLEQIYSKSLMHVDCKAAFANL